MAEIAMKKTFSWFIFCENLWTYIHLLDYRLCFQVFWLHYIYIGETSATANWQFWENQVNDWTVFLVPQDALKVILWVSHTFEPIWLMWPCQVVKGPADVTVVVGDTYGDDVRGNDGGAGHGGWQGGATWWPNFKLMQIYIIGCSRKWKKVFHWLLSFWMSGCPAGHWYACLFVCLFACLSACLAMLVYLALPCWPYNPFVPFTLNIWPER